MKLKGIGSAIGNAMGKAGFALKRRSPEICLVTGIVGMVGTVILACIATRHVDEVISDTQEELVNAENTALANAQDERPLKVKVYIRAGWKFAKLYGPTIFLGGASIVSLLASHRAMKKRELILGAAYASLDKGFKEYRARVSEALGEEAEKDIFFGLKKKEESEQEEGTEIQEREAKAVTVSNGIVSPYARFFDETCVATWTKDAEWNLCWLRKQEARFTEQLRARGYLFLNDVYDALGMQKTEAGHHVGWIYDNKYPHGDGYVDFGIYRVERERNRAFVNGLERAILLDFNVDGVIDADPRVWSYDYKF